MQHFFKIFWLIVLLQAYAHAQQNNAAALSNKTKMRMKGNQGGEFSGTQWWIGLKGGVNFGRAMGGEKFSVYQSVANPSSEDFDKDYQGLLGIGYQFGAVLSYNFYKWVSLVFAPDYNASKSAYKNRYRWESPASNVTLNQTHTYTHYYVYIPLMVRLDVMRTRFRPYVQGGIGYAIRTASQKKTLFESTDASTGGSNVVTNDFPQTGVNALFITSMVYVPLGVGVNYEVGNSRLGLEVGYRLGLTNVTNRKERYSDERNISTGDVPDDMRLQQLEINASITFPMKFLRTGLFKPAKP